MQNAIDRIEKTEIISKEEIKRILDEIMQLNEENGVTIPIQAKELSKKLGEVPNRLNIGKENRIKTV